MGYTTHYIFEIKPFDAKIIATMKDEMKIAYEGESIKWSHHEEDMKAFSTRFPGVLFLIHGEGEAAGDIWRKWFRDGRLLQHSKAKIVIDDFKG